MAKVPGVTAVLDAADYISEVRNALAKMKTLEQGQKLIVTELSELEKRVRELEASLREAKSDIRLEAVKETQTIVNAVQGQLYGRITDVSVEIDRIKRHLSEKILTADNQSLIGSDGEDKSETTDSDSTK